MRLFRPPLLALLLAITASLPAAEPHPSLPPPVIPDYLGVNIHFTDPRPGEMEMLAAAGFKWVRMDFGWGGTERIKGQYDFSAYDRLAATLDKFHLRAVFILDYGNSLYADLGDTSPFTSRGNTPEFREAFAKWAVAAVQHFKGRGYLWEMWNEPNGGFWKSADKRSDYIALAKATGEALRRATLLGPKGEAFIGPATSTIDLPYLEACFQAGLLDYWDAVSVHPYRQNAPETVEEEYRSLRMLIRKYAPKDKVIPIVSGEWGYSSAWPSLGKDESARAELQGKYLPREFLTNIANDVALSIWYDWHDDGTNPKEGEHRFGIVGNEYHPGREPVYDPKPAYTAMRTLNEQLNGFRFNKRLRGGVTEVTLLFERNQDFRVCRWNTLAPGCSLSDVIQDGAFADVFDSWGKKVEFQPEAADMHILTSDLHYVKPIEERDVRGLKFAAALQRLPLEYVVHVPQQLAIEASLRNPFVETLDYDMETAIPTLNESWLEDFVSPDETVAPRLRLEGHGSITETTTFLIENPKPRHLAVQVAYTKRGDRGSWGVRQETPVLVTNSLTVEEVYTGADFILLRVMNPSKEPLRGDLRLEFTEGSGIAGNCQPLPVEMESGKTELLVRVPIASCTVAMGKRGKDWRTFHHFGWLHLKDSHVELFFRPLLSCELDAGLLRESKVIAEGDAKVAGQATIQPGEPQAGPSPIGIPSMKMSYRSAAGWKFFRLVTTRSENLAIGTPLKMAAWELPHKFALWIYGDGKGTQGRIRFTDSTGQTFQSDGQQIDWTGWRYVTFPIMLSDDVHLSHWGGANDGTVHYPIKWDSVFLLDNVSRKEIEGEIYLSAPTLLY